MGIDRPLAVVEIEGRILAGQLQIGLVERTDRADVAPVTVEFEAVDGAGLDGVRDDVAAEVVKMGVFGKQVDQAWTLKK